MASKEKKDVRDGNSAKTTRRETILRLIASERIAVYDSTGAFVSYLYEEPHGDTSSIPNYDASQMTGVPDGSTVTAIGDSLISGNADAEYDLGCALMDGVDGEIDCYQALRWFRLAGAQGHVKSQYRVGYALAHGAGCAIDLQQAATWLRKAAVNGDPKGQYEFGLLFIHPDYAKRNEEEAFRWIRLSALAGFAPAQYQLALFYQSGEGTLASYEEAFTWARRAAAQGEEKALLLLASLFRFGAGTQTNLLAAYAIAAFLSGSDNTAAAALMQTLEPQTSAAQRSQVQKMLSATKTPSELIQNIAMLKN